MDLSSGHLPLQRGMLEATLSVLLDFPSGRPRFIYLAIEDGRITALAMLAMVDPVKGVPCFQLGVAVPDALRGQGRAKRIVRSALAELKHGSAKNNVPRICVEAVVGTDNIPSQKVASDCLSRDPILITDQVSGLPALHYTTQFELGS